MRIPTREIGDAIIEYLDRRGITVDRGKVSITYDRDVNEFFVIVKDVELQPKEGPYR